MGRPVFKYPYCCRDGISFWSSTANNYKHINEEVAMHAILSCGVRVLKLESSKQTLLLTW
jgi:hypothetical protein